MRTQLGEIALLSRADGFRKQGEKCQLKAEQEMDPLDGQLWLLMAKQWSQLARNGPASGAGGRNTTPPPPRPKPPPPPPKMVWHRIDGQHGPEVTEQEEADLATCKALAETLVAQLQQGQTFNLNLRACMGQHGYELVAARPDLAMV
jgi:hypothetical protein